MGWTSMRTSKTVKEVILENCSGANTEVVDYSFQSGEAYVAFRVKATGDIMACVFLTSKKNGEVGYKDMEETCGPYYFNCPERILNQLTAPLNENARVWREKCRTWHRTKIAMKEAMKNLKPGQVLGKYVYIRPYERGGKYPLIVKDLETWQIVRISHETAFSCMNTEPVNTQISI